MGAAQGFLSDGLQGFVSDGLQGRNLLAADAMWIIHETFAHDFLSKISENRREETFPGNFGETIRWAVNPTLSAWVDDVGGDGAAIWATNALSFPTTIEQTYEISVADFSLLMLGPLVDWGEIVHTNIGIGGSSAVVWHAIVVELTPLERMEELSIVDLSVIRLKDNAWIEPLLNITIGGSPDVIWSSDLTTRYFEHSPVDFSQVRSQLHTFPPVARVDGFGGDDDLLVSVSAGGPTGRRVRKHSVIDFSVLLDEAISPDPGLQPVGIGGS